MKTKTEMTPAQRRLMASIEKQSREAGVPAAVREDMRRLDRKTLKPRRAKG